MTRTNAHTFRAAKVVGCDALLLGEADISVQIVGRKEFGPVNFTSSDGNPIHFCCCQRPETGRVINQSAKNSLSKCSLIELAEAGESQWYSERGRVQFDQSGDVCINNVIHNTDWEACDVRHVSLKAMIDNSAYSWAEYFNYDFFVAS